MTLHSFLNSEASHHPHWVLIGNPVSHSLSPLMHNTAARHYGMEARYHAVAVEAGEINRLAAFFNRELLRGVNVTIPYKQQMLAYMDELDPVCRMIGAVNTIARSGGRLVGYNTDIYGFTQPLQHLHDEIEGGRAIIFGTGGAARAVVQGLESLGAERVVLVSRSPQQVDQSSWPPGTEVTSYDGWPAYADETTLYVNTTPLGMAPRERQSPVRDDQQRYLHDCICYDIVYHPRHTRFLQLARSAGARTIGGLEMLIHQGSRSFELWTGQPFPLPQVRQALQAHLSRSH